MSNGQTKNKNKMNEVLIVGIILFTGYAVIKLFCDNSIKRMLIRNNMVDQSEKLILKDSLEGTGSRNSSLKWGLVAFFTGIGILVGTSLYPWLNSYSHNEAYYLVKGIIPAIVMIFASLGFIVSFFVERKMRN